MFHFTTSTNPKVSNWPLQPERNAPSTKDNKKPKEQVSSEKK